MNDTTTYEISDQDETFCTQFESCEFPPEKFKHREHLKLAYIYLAHHDVDTAFEKMRGAILNFIAQNGVDPGKFHETITRAWILAVRHFMEKTGGADSADHFVDQNPAMLDAKIMLSHYSAELLFSEEARERFADPDLDPIPRYDAENET
jgi:hypothetical protein